MCKCLESRVYVGLGTERKQSRKIWNEKIQIGAKTLVDAKGQKISEANYVPCSHFIKKSNEMFF